MAYRITYEWQKEKELTKKHGIPVSVYFGMLAAALAFAVRLIYPQSSEVFRDLLHPLTDETVIAAFGELVEQIGEGAPLEEAAAAFCTEIISNAQ